MPKTRRNRGARKAPLKFTSTGKEIKKEGRGRPLTKSFPQTKKTSHESKKLVNETVEDVKGPEEELIIQSNFDDEDSSHQGLEHVIHDISNESSGEDANEVQPTKQKYCFLKELENPMECGKEEVVAYLRQFDLTREYGPCSSITRTERYLRAVNLGLDPPHTVQEVIDRFVKEDPEVSYSYLHRYRHIL